MTPEEYARTSMDEKLVDSMLYVALEYYQSIDPDLEYLQKYENFRKLDWERTVKLGEEYSANHP